MPASLPLPVLRSLAGEDGADVAAARLDDPAGQAIEPVRIIRDEIRTPVRNLLDELGVEAVTAA